MASRQRVLVIANRTVDSPELVATLQGRHSRTPSVFTVLIPAVPHGLAWAADMKAGWDEAIARAEVTARRMRGAEIELEDVVVGDPDPFAAAGDVLHSGGRLRRAFDLPVSHVTAHSRPARSAPRARSSVTTPV